jgi:hypothetical protein
MTIYEIIAWYAYSSIGIVLFFLSIHSNYKFLQMVTVHEAWAREEGLNPRDYYTLKSHPWARMNCVSFLAATLWPLTLITNPIRPIRAYLDTKALDFYLVYDKKIFKEKGII